MYQTSKLAPSLHIHPNYTEKIKTIYTVEYTEKDEPFKDDYSNAKKIETLDLESSIDIMFKLRQRNKFNINVYTLTEIDGQWITEDYCNDCEQFTDTQQSVDLKHKNNDLLKAMEEMQKELDLYKKFIAQYNATKEFKKFKDEQNTHTYYYRLRPPSPGCQPKQGLLETNNKEIEYNNRKYWGYAVYDRELSDKELYEYDLDK